MGPVRQEGVYGRPRTMWAVRRGLCRQDQGRGAAAAALAAGGQPGQLRAPMQAVLRGGARGRALHLRPRRHGGRRDVALQMASSPAALRALRVLSGSAPAVASTLCVCCLSAPSGAVRSGGRSDVVLHSCGKVSAKGAQRPVLQGAQLPVGQRGAAGALRGLPDQRAGHRRAAGLAGGAAGPAAHHARRARPSGACGSCRWGLRAPVLPGTRGFCVVSVFTLAIALQAQQRPESRVGG